MRGRQSFFLILACGLSLGVTVLLLLWGCGSARRGPSLTAPLPETPAVQLGQQAFMRYCNMCHPGGAAGLGPALNNKPLPAALIRFQVRRGLGAMPAFPRDRLTEEELDFLIVYLRTLRRLPPLE